MIRKASLLLISVALCATMLAAPVAVSPWKSPHVTFTDQNGVPLVAGCVFTYSGGTSTALATYTDSTGNTANADPVVLDSTGSANIWLGPSNYKFAIWGNGGTLGNNCASGAQLWTVDMVPGNIFNNTTVTGGTWVGGTITGAAISGGTITGAAITNSTIDSTPIGQTTPASGKFTSMASGLDALSFSSTPVFPAGTYGYFTMTLSNNVTSSSITGGTNGQLITFDLCQNGIGQIVGGITTGFTFAWPANYLNPPVVNPILSACTIATAFYNGGFWTTVSTTPQLLAGNFDTVPYSATPIFPAASYSNFAIVLTGNVTSSTIPGGVAGQVATMDVCQNGTGGNTFVWPTNLLHAPPVSAGASSCTGVAAVYDGTTNWNTIANSSVTTTTPLTGNLDTIPFTATPIYSTQNFSSFAMTLAGNVTSSSIAGGTSGQLIAIILKQGSSITPAPLAAPTFSTLTTGGAVPAATAYFAKCSYLFGAVESLPSAEATETTGSGATNSITWNCPVGVAVTSYKFYIGTGTGAENNWFTTSSSSYIQIGVPSTGTPGIPLTGSTYTVAWPTNLINAPVMSNGIGATTGLTAVYDGTNWQTVGTSGGGGFSSGNTAAGYWVKDPTGSITERGQITVTSGGTQTTGPIAFPLTFPTALDSLVVSAGNYPSGVSPDALTVYHVGASTTGATVIVRCAVNIGGTGCAGLTNSIPIHWIAIGR